MKTVLEKDQEKIEISIKILNLGKEYRIKNHYHKEKVQALMIIIIIQIILIFVQRKIKGINIYLK